jgi:hypothetical protein
MELAVTLNQTDLNIFNCHRMYLKVILVSDVTTADGKKVRTKVWQGIPDRSNSREIKWPPQPNPNKRCWKVWRSCLTSILGANDKGILFTSLPRNTGSADWPWIYLPGSHQLFEVGAGWGYRTAYNPGQRPICHEYVIFNQTATACVDIDIPADSINVADGQIKLDGLGGPRYIEPNNNVTDWAGC